MLFASWTVEWQLSTYCCAVEFSFVFSFLRVSLTQFKRCYTFFALPYYLFNTNHCFFLNYVGTINTSYSKNLFVWTFEHRYCTYFFVRPMLSSTKMIRAACFLKNNFLRVPVLLVFLSLSKINEIIFFCHSKKILHNY